MLTFLFSEGTIMHLLPWKFGGNSHSEFQYEFSCLKSILRWENIFHPLFIRRQRLEESSFCPCLPPRQLFSRQNGLNISPLRKTVIMVDMALMITWKWFNFFLTRETLQLKSKSTDLSHLKKMFAWMLIIEVMTKRMITFTVVCNICTF